MTPRVTTIVTVHKRTEFLAQALESAVNQSYRDFEVVVIDDSGTACAQDIYERFARGAAIKYRANARTIGVAASLRETIAAAQGEFISVLNDDDIWERDFLSELVPALEQDRQRALAFSDHWIVLADGAIDLAETETNSRRYGRATLPQGELADAARFALIQNGVPLAMAAVFRKEYLDLNLLQDEVGGAYDFWISCALAASGGKFYYVPKRLTRYRVHARTETGRRDPNKSEPQVFIFRQLLERNWFPQFNRYLRSRFAGALFRLGRDRLYFNRTTAARSCFMNSLDIQPNWRPIAATLLSFLPRSVRVRMRLTAASHT